MKKYKIDENSTLMNRALYALARIYYDRQYLGWNQLEKIAVVLHQNSMVSDWNKNLRKSFEQMAKYLFEIDKYIKGNMRTNNSVLFVTENLHFMTLGEMDGKDHASCYNDIAKLSKKMRDCIQDKSIIDYYILQLAEELKRKYINLTIQKEIDFSIKSELRGETEKLNEKTAPEDIFRQIKVVKKLWKKNKRIKSAEKEQEKTRNPEWSHETAIEVIENFFNDDSKKETMATANALLKRLNDLCENTSDGLKKQLLVREIVDFKIDIIGGNMERIQTEIARLTESLEIEENQIGVVKR